MSWTHPESIERKLCKSDALAIQLPSSSQLMENRAKENKTSISKSVESHIMAYGAELSRTTEKNIQLDELKEELRRSI